MDVEASGAAANERAQTMAPLQKKQTRWGLLLVYAAFMAVGTIGGPLLQRLYFIHGGGRKWLSSCLQTIGFPFMFVPLFYLYTRRFGRRKTKFFIGPKLFFASAFLGMLLGADNYLYSAGLAYLPVSTSSLLFATQLAFTALFAFIIVRQKFTFYSINSVMLMTLGAVVLALHTANDRPPGVSNGKYFMGFFFTLAGAVLLGFILPCIEFCYSKAGQAVTYTVVMQFQVVFTLSATIFCLIGMAINNDFKIIPREAKEFAIGEVKYYVVIISSAVVWQFLFIGTLGVVYCSSSLFVGIFSSVLLPLTPVAAVIAFDEKFTGEKGMSLALCLWGFTSYFVGEYKRAGRQVPSVEPAEVEGDGL
ncbi:purine permease 1-like [Aristolochia californica]|uniref:purine permease 1-like n=1 Tax=Aristolochia californica TaxID=171875 RepID=UPI0035E23806